MCTGPLWGDSFAGEYVCLVCVCPCGHACMYFVHVCLRGYNVVLLTLVHNLAKNAPFLLNPGHAFETVQSIEGLSVILAGTGVTALRMGKGSPFEKVIVLASVNDTFKIGACWSTRQFQAWLSSHLWREFWSGVEVSSTPYSKS